MKAGLFRAFADERRAVSKPAGGWVVSISSVTCLHLPVVGEDDSQLTDACHEDAGTHVIQPQLNNMELGRCLVFWLAAWVLHNGSCNKQTDTPVGLIPLS